MHTHTHAEINTPTSYSFTTLWFLYIGNVRKCIIIYVRGVGSGTASTALAVLDFRIRF